MSSFGSMIDELEEEKRNKAMKYKINDHLNILKRFKKGQIKFFRDKNGNIESITIQKLHKGYCKICKKKRIHKGLFYLNAGGCMATEICNNCKESTAREINTNISFDELDFIKSAEELFQHFKQGDKFV